MEWLTWSQWLLVLGSSLVLLALAPTARTVKSFFYAATRTGEAPGFWLLTSSLVISWIFAKSITVAADLGAAYGLVGGVAYAGYYGSFCVAGIVIYQLRTKGGFQSIHQFLQKKHGKSALLLFSVLLAIRLFNEIWSNTMVIGLYFGEAGSTAYYASIGVFTALTLLYSLKGGMRSSMFTDAVQMVLFGILLVGLLGLIFPQTEGGIVRYVQEGTWSLATGGNLLLVALIQMLSYPFHDPVMTDRGFVAPTSTTLKSFLWAGLIGAICIVLFSGVGIYARIHGLEGSAPVAAGRHLGTVVLLVMNLIMITSASSTLDSTFSSFSKLVILDLGCFQPVTIAKGRLVMAGLALLGILPVFFNPEILSATTVSGTMVIGLAPVFLCWNWAVPRWVFHVSVSIGLATGITLLVGCPPALDWFPGKYGDYLSLNLVGTALCFSVFIIARLFYKAPLATDPVIDSPL